MALSSTQSSTAVAAARSQCSQPFHRPIIAAREHFSGEISPRHTKLLVGDDTSHMTISPFSVLEILVFIILATPQRVNHTLYFRIYVRNDFIIIYQPERH